MTPRMIANRLCLALVGLPIGAALLAGVGCEEAESDYHSQRVDLVAEIDFLGDEAAQALGTEPRYGEAWQEAVSKVAGEIEALTTRIEAIEPPRQYAGSHALLVGGTEKMAQSLRTARIAGANSDVEGLEEALADIQIALQLLREAREEFEAGR